jgi:DNA helicase-2/ATP-dependent DNA helicase PcrA
MKTTPAQQRAIDSNSPAILCPASAGSGKSSTLVARIQRLIKDGVAPSAIVSITFTVAASKVLQERLGEVKLGINSTVHAFALKMLKRHGAGIGYGESIGIIDSEASLELLASKAKQMGCKMPLDKLATLKAKGRPAGRMDLPQTVIAGYYDELRESGLVDIDGLLTEFLRLLKTGHQLDNFQHVLWDETQDMSDLDWAIADALPIPNKFFSGDDFQAIYGFRGGRVAKFLAYAKSPGVEVITLQENFRSHSEICDAANRLISHNKDRINKQTISVKGPGGKVEDLGVCANEGAEIAKVSSVLQSLLKQGQAPEEIAILARTNALCAAYRSALKATGIRVNEAVKSTLPPDWHYAKAFMELLVNPENDTLAYFFLIARFQNRGCPIEVARERANLAKKAAALAGMSINQHSLMHKSCPLSLVPAALTGIGVSKETYMRVVAIVRDLGDDAELPELTLAMASGDPVTEKKVTGVQISTVHGYKGLEADVVFLVGFEDSQWPGMRATSTPDDLPEARRLCYVAVTRARKALYISSASSRMTPWKQIQQQHPSRFLAELLS